MKKYYETNCGIYKIENQVTDDVSGRKKIYVGSSCNLKSRKYDHFFRLRKNIHCNPYLQNAYNKVKELYGENSVKDKFEFIIIEEVKKIKDKTKLKEILEEREDFYMKELGIVGANMKINHDIGYNICPKACSCLGKEVSVETRNKISKLHKGKIVSKETRNKISEIQKGLSPLRNLTEEQKKEAYKKAVKTKKSDPEKYQKTIEKIRESNKGRVVSEDTKQKLREINLGKKFTVEQKKTLSNAQKRAGNRPGEKCIENAIKANTGRIKSEEERKKISEGNKGKVLSEEHKAKIGAASIINNSIKVKNVDTGEIFNSLLEATKKYGTRHICCVCKGKRKTAAGYRWEYYVDNIG